MFVRQTNKTDKEADKKRRRQRDRAERQNIVRDKLTIDRQINKDRRYEVGR